MSIHTYKYNSSFTLKSRAMMGQLDIAFHAWGQINSSSDNIVWVIHALTKHFEGALYLEVNSLNGHDGY